MRMVGGFPPGGEKFTIVVVMVVVPIGCTGGLNMDNYYKIMPSEV